MHPLSAALTVMHPIWSSAACCRISVSDQTGLIMFIGCAFHASRGTMKAMGYNHHKFIMISSLSPRARVKRELRLAWPRQTFNRCWPQDCLKNCGGSGPQTARFASFIPLVSIPFLAMNLQKEAKGGNHFNLYNPECGPNEQRCIFKSLVCAWFTLMFNSKPKQFHVRSPEFQSKCVLTWHMFSFFLGRFVIIFKGSNAIAGHACVIDNRCSQWVGAPRHSHACCLTFIYTFGHKQLHYVLRGLNLAKKIYQDLRNKRPGYRVLNWALFCTVFWFA